MLSALAGVLSYFSIGGSKRMLENKDEKEVEEKTIQILKDCNKPVSISYVAYNLKVCWSTARGLLLKMSLDGKIRAVETTRGFFFSLKN